MNHTLRTTDRPPGDHEEKAGMPAAIGTPAPNRVTPTSSLPRAGNKTGAARPAL